MSPTGFKIDVLIKTLEWLKANGATDGEVYLGKHEAMLGKEQGPTVTFTSGDALAYVRPGEPVKTELRVKGEIA